MSNKYYNLDKEIKKHPEKPCFILGARNAGRTYFVEHNILNNDKIHVIRKEVNYADNTL